MANDVCSVCGGTMEQQYGNYGPLLCENVSPLDAGVFITGDIVDCQRYMEWLEAEQQRTIRRMSESCITCLRCIKVEDEGCNLIQRKNAIKAQLTTMQG